jgi:hypothetical protein
VRHSHNFENKILQTPDHHQWQLSITVCLVLSSSLRDESTTQRFVGDWSFVHPRVYATTIGKSFKPKMLISAIGGIDRHTC